jgi:peroxiredoxin
MTLHVGLPAPDFTLRDQHGQTITLSSLRGERAVVVLFYPFAFSGVCTGELGELREALPEFQNDRVQLLAVSCDPMYALRAYADHQELDFPLLSDFWPHGEVARAYGVFNDSRGCAVRGTFVVDRKGVLRWQVVNAMPDARDIDAYRKALADLGA